MTVANPEHPNSESVTTERVLRITAAATIGWLVATLVPIAMYTFRYRDVKPAMVHLAALVVAMCVVRMSRSNLEGNGARGAIVTARDWLPLALGIYLYVELRWLIEGAGQPHADALVVQWERALFPSDPSRSLATRFPSVALSEFVHLSYLTFYAFVFVPPVLLYLRGRRAEFAEMLLAVTIAFGICFSAFILFPVDGPRFLFGPAPAPEAFFRSVTLQLLASASSRGTAFPSAHVAATIVSVACLLRFFRPAGLVTLPVAVGLVLGTVYGGFHYVVDVLAGAVVGGIAIAASSALVRRQSAQRSASPRANSS